MTSSLHPISSKLWLGVAFLSRNLPVPSRCLTWDVTEGLPREHGAIHHWGGVLNDC
jgi:hypothetical protein